MDIIIDTHCHPQFPQYDADRDGVIRRALDAGVRMVCVGTDLDSSRRAISLAEQYEGIWASVGLHPNDIGDVAIEFETLIQHEKVVAVGEVGLDYYRTTDPKLQKEQRERLSGFIELAQRHSKPLIIHCRNAHDDMLQILPTGKGVIHSFTGSLDQALLYREKGYHIGLNGIVTFSKEYEAMVRGLPLNRILLETDAPYLAPAPYRGTRNEPVYILETARMVAAIRGIPVDELISATTTNAYECLSINK